MERTALEYNTFSITARCQRTGEVGTAVATQFIAVGALCSFGRSGVGAISSQAFVNPYLGIWGLDYLAKGHSAQETLAYLVERDKGAGFRQLGIVDSKGGSAAFTGENCQPWQGNMTGPNFALAGNQLVSVATLDAMKESFESNAELPLGERLLTALSSGHAAGGDKRGHRSAGVKVYGAAQFPILDLRVDLHDDPVGELIRIYDVAEEILLPLMETLPIPDADAESITFRRSAIGKDGASISY